MSGSRTDRQRRRILARLQSHGTTHQGEWLRDGECPDGEFESITRLAARIEELQKPKHGNHKIVSGGTDGRFKVYRLVDVAHMPTAKRLPHKPWSTGWLCLNTACLTSHPADYTGECCGEDRFLIRLTIRPAAAAADPAREAA